MSRQRCEDAEPDPEPGPPSPGDGKLKELDDETLPLLGRRSRSGFEWDYGIVDFVLDLRDHVGAKQLWIIFYIQHMSKGFVYQMSQSATPYLLKIVHISGSQSNEIGCIQNLPWAIKPMMGLLSDLVPIAGIKKMPYMLFSTALGIAASLWLGILPTDQVNYPILAVGLFLISFQVSFCDLMSEAKYTEKMAECPSRATALMAYVQFGVLAGNLTASLLLAPMLAFLGEQGLFIFLAIPPAIAVPALLANYMEEAPVTREETRAIRAMYWQQKEILAVAAVLLVGSLALLVATIGDTDPWAGVWVGLIAGGAVCLCCMLVFSPTIGKFALFGLLIEAANVDISGAAFYFYTDSSQILPDGPHFTPVYYNTVLGSVACVISLGGTVFYQHYMSDWNYRRVLIVTNLLTTLFSLVDVIIFARLNIHFGISDSVACIGNTILGNMLQTLAWIPQVVCWSMLCPPGMEATMFALLAGCTNLGDSISDVLGAALMDQLSVNPTGQVGDEKQLKHLWLVGLVAAFMPTICVLLTYRLIPDACPGDTIMPTGDATSGSLWRRLTASHED